MTVLVSGLMAPAALYLSFRLYNLIKKRWQNVPSIKWAGPLLISSFFLFPLAGLIDYYTTNNVDLLAYPKILTYWFWFGLVFLFQLISWVVIADLLKLASRLHSSIESKVDRWYSHFIIAVFVLVFIFVGLKMHNNTTQIVAETQTIPVKEIPQPLKDFKIVHISDIQGDEYTGRQDIARYIQKVNKLNPDLIIFTGDLISYGTDFIAMAARELGKATATYGTVAVVGDHDYWAGTDTVEKALEKQGISLLRDENYSIRLDSVNSFVVTGVTEVYSKASSPNVVDSLTRNTADPQLKVFASHQVDKHLVKSAQQNNYDLMLAGHTHGGQIRIPFMGMSFSAAERETKYVSGLYQEGALPIHINNGLGFTLGPVRYGAPPTVTLLRLYKK